MATTHTDTNVNQLVINKMTKQEYDNLQQVSDTELYLVEEQVDSVVTQNSTNPVQSGAVYEALQQSSSNIKDGITTFTKNNETIGTTSANQSVNQTIALPNDVVMCNLINNKALASYAAPITRFKYIEDHGWVDMDRSDIQYNEGTGEWTGTFVSLDITEGEYYYDMDNDTVFVADENSEMQDVTSTVIIQGDSNKLYCDITTNMLYRYDGTNFVALTSEGKTYTLSSNNENIRLTDSDGQTQDVSLNTLINGLSVGNSDPQDDDYIISQYVNGGTTTTTYHRRPLSKFWNWIKTKLGIGTNDGTFLRKDGTWATPSGTTYSAGQGLVKNGSTFKIGSGTNAHLSKQAAKSGDYILITINDYNAWMLSFKVRFYGDYKCDEYIISGYNYSSSYWYSPSVVLISSSGENRDVKFGYTAQTHLWVAIPNANYYGVDVLDVVCGYQQVNSYDGLFTLTETSSLSGTTQTTITISPLAKKSDIPSITGMVNKSGDSMSGTLTFTTANAINYNANNGNINMIRFKTGDKDGHGIVIGGGGLTVIGAGESASTVAAQTSSGGSETMQVCSDENIEFYTNCQSGFSSAKKSYLDTSGNMYVNGSQVRTGTVAIANGGTGATTAAAARTNLGLGSAATLTADTAASNNTVVKRTANGYINATYFNQSSSAETPVSSSYIMFCNADGYLRKSSIANIKSLVNTNTTYSAGTGLSLSSTTFSVSYGTTAGTACQGNDSRLSNSRPASDVYAWAKSASLAAAMQSSITNGSVTSGTNCTCSVAWQQVGNLVSFTGYIKPNSSYTTAGSVRVGVSGTYKQTVYFAGIQTNKSAVFRLTTTGYLENEGSVAVESYYFQVIGIRVI